MYKVWEVIDISFKAEIKVNPYTDVEFSAIFVSGNNRKEIYGFYNGDDEFLLRFSADTIGEYSYVTKSNISELNGKTGSFCVKDKDETQHGPLKLSETCKKNLYYTDGTYYNLLAFECDWLFALSYSDSKQMKKTRELAREISLNGFNQVVMNVYAYDILDETPYWDRDPGLNKEYDFGGREDIFPFLGSNSSPDHSQLNPDFFKHLDRVISILNEYNIVAHLMIYVWNKKVNWPTPGSKEDDAYFDHVIKRYQAFPNILWDISKEALFYGHQPSYFIDRVKRCRTLDKYSRLLTVHDYSFCEKNSDLVDIISTQSWDLDIYRAMLNINEKFPDKVVFNIEHGGYEKGPYQVFTGNYVDPKVCLRRNYDIMFSGVYSTYYWQDSSWNVIMLPKEAEPKPAFNYYKIMSDFFNIYRLDDFTPTKNYGVSGRFLINKSEDTILVYIPKENYSTCIVKINTMEIKQASIQYFNTITGEYSNKEDYKVIGHNQFISPFTEDSILIFCYNK